MKKYIIAMLLLFIPCVTYALTMCARDNSLVIALNSGIEGTGDFAYNTAEFTWRTNFNYGDILGVAACVNIGALYNTVGSVLNYNGGQISIASIAQASLTGGYCWCRMTHPASSLWVYRNVYSSVKDCAAVCAKTCAEAVAGTSDVIRKSMFNNITS